MKKTILSLFTIFLISIAPTVATNLNKKPKIKNLGIPLIKSYLVKEYSASSVIYGSQNYDVLQGLDGKMYFANVEGLLIYDGVNWTRFQLPKRPITYTLSQTNDGIIYIGGANELGFLSSTENGKLEYNSLRDRLGTLKQSGFTVWNSFLVKDELVFIADKNLLIYNPSTKAFKIVDNFGSHRSIFISQDQIFVLVDGTLKKLKDSKWQRVKRSRLTSNTNTILSIDIDEHKSLIITNDGFFDFSSEMKIQIPPNVEVFLKNSVLNKAEILLGQYITISTNKGLLITDFRGNPIQFLNQEKGLTDNKVFNSHIDKSGQLWVGTNSGIDKVEITSPFTIFDKRSGISGNVSYVEKHENNIYLASATGTYKQDWKQLSNSLSDVSFEKLDPQESRFLLRNHNDLFSLAATATLEFKNGSFKKIKGTGKEKYWVGMHYENSEDILFGSDNGKLLHLVKMNGNWVVKTELNPELNNVLFMSEGEENDVWVCNRAGVYRINYDKETGTIISQKKYDKSHGLPYDVDNYVFNIASKATFTTLNGVYRYDPPSDGFVKDERFISTVGNFPLLRMTEDDDGNVYCLSDGYLYLKKTLDGYKMTRILNEKLANYNPFNMVAFDSTNVFLPTFNAFVHVDPTIAQIQDPFDAKFAQINSIGSNDSLYYGGFGNLPANLELDYSNNAIRFSFSSDYLQNNDQMVYKWRLKGLDQDWSGWSFETTKDYTNLPHGAYHFEVIARNILFVESSPASIQLTIKAPWYFTIWAYTIYAFGFLLFMWFVVKLNTRRLELEKRKLEKIVEDRTKQIKQQKEAAEKDAQTIAAQNDKLIEMDDLKGRFFLNISHELRTPLTLTMGTVDQALKGRYGSLNDELYAHLKSTKSNNQRLLKMVNNILDISKLEGGKMHLNASLTQPSTIIAKAIDFFSSKFHGKNIQLKNRVATEVELYLDKDKFETIFINLIANAFKYTPKGGVIEVSLTESNEQITIRVKDNGIGIPSTDLNAVFDRFYQSTNGPSDGGTGLGLALTKELVELHKGSISVESEINKGSAFIVSFLKGKNHLTTEQILKEEVPLNDGILNDKYSFIDDVEQVKETNPKTVFLDKEKPHVLIVEDNAEMSKFISELLSTNYAISIVENGQDAINFLEDQIPDLILTDYLMPIMNGYEMALQIKKTVRFEFIPMIFLTARTEEQDKIEVLNLGVDDYLFKPFNSDELLVRIKNLLHIKKQRIDFLSQKSIDPRDIEWKEFPSKLKLDIDNYIKAHIKEEITGEDLSNFTNQSERSLYRKIKVNTGLSLMQYIKEFRLRKARSLFEQKAVQTVSEASYAVGFNYLSHFTKSYKERFGKQPSEYLD